MFTLSLYITAKNIPRLATFGINMLYQKNNK
ncbi:MAG: hypothetical protein ACI892_002074, partial [Marinobacter maritimus]